MRMTIETITVRKLILGALLVASVLLAGLASPLTALRVRFWAEARLSSTRP